MLGNHNSISWLRADVRYMRQGLCAATVGDFVVVMGLFGMLGMYMADKTHSFWTWTLGSYRFDVALGDVVLLGLVRMLVLLAVYVLRGSRSLRTAGIVCGVSVLFAGVKAGMYSYGKAPRNPPAGGEEGLGWNADAKRTSTGLEASLLAACIAVPLLVGGLYYKLLVRITRVHRLLESPSLLGPGPGTVGGSGGLYGAGGVGSSINGPGSGSINGPVSYVEPVVAGRSTQGRRGGAAASLAPPPASSNSSRRSGRRELSDFSTRNARQGASAAALPSSSSTSGAAATAAASSSSSRPVQRGPFVPIQLDGSGKTSVREVMASFVPGLVERMQTTSTGRDAAREASRRLLDEVMGGGGDWQEGVESNGVVVSSHPESPFWFRAETEVEGSPAKVMALWCNDRVRIDWDRSLKDYRHLASVSEAEDLVWMEWALPWPMASRDYVLLRTEEPLEGGSFLCTFVSVARPEEAEAGSLRMSLNAVRESMVLYGIHLAPPEGGSPGRTRATLVMMSGMESRPSMQSLAPMFRADGVFPQVLASLREYAASGSVVPSKTHPSVMSMFMAYSQGVVSQDACLAGFEPVAPHEPATRRRSSSKSISFQDSGGSSDGRYQAMAVTALESMEAVLEETPWTEDNSGDVDARNRVFRGHHGPLAAVKSVAEISGAEVDEVVATLCSPQERLKWDTGAVSLHELRHFEDGMEIMWMERQMPWPASNRDFVYVQRVLETESGATAVVLVSIDDEDDFPVPAAYTVSPDLVRASFLSGGGFLIEPSAEGVVLTALSVVDLGLKGKQARQLEGRIPHPSLAAAIARMHEATHE